MGMCIVSSSGSVANGWGERGEDLKQGTDMT